MRFYGGDYDNGEDDGSSYGMMMVLMVIGDDDNGEGHYERR